MSRGLFYFIIFDLVVATLLITSFKNKSHTESVQERPSITDTIESWSNDLNNYWKKIEDYNNSKIQNAQTQSNISFSNEQSHNYAPVCITYGPLNLEQKSTMDVILSNNNKNPFKDIMITKMPLYEVYWNLGPDKIQAITLFEKQKNEGALQDEKFKMVKDVQGNWIVPISVVSGNIELAKQMSIDLRKSSKTIGGKWQYRNKSEGYFYQFKNINNLPANKIDIINRSMSSNVLKMPCT